VSYFFSVVGLAFVVYIIYSVKNDSLDEKESFLWLLVAAIAVVLALNYKIVDLPAKWLGVSYPPALFLLLAVMFVILYLLRLTVKYSRLAANSRELIQELALLRMELQEQITCGNAVETEAQKMREDVSANY